MRLRCSWLHEKALELYLRTPAYTAPILISASIERMPEVTEAEKIAKLAARERRKETVRASRREAFHASFDKELNTYSDLVENEIFPRRQKHDDAVKAYEASKLAAGVEGPQFAKPPAYEQVEPLSWWARRCQEFPLLMHFVRSLLCRSISAAEIERLFSKCGLVLTHLRNRIGSEKEDLYCLTSYNINREWKQALAAAGDADEEGVIAAVLLGVEMELLDVDDDVDA